MNGAEWAAAEHLAMLGTSARNLANTVRNEHNPECACHDDGALSEPIGQGEME